MSLRSVLIGILLAGAWLPAAAAAPNGCAQGSGEHRRALWDGYSVEIAPASGATAPERCRAAVKSADGATVFEISAPETFLHELTGSDINADGKQDVLIESHRARGQCCFTYSIVTPGSSPALTREITTSVPLTFEDRDQTGKIEIAGRDNAFSGFDGLPAEFSPAPIAIFRLHGNTLYYVSQAYWPDYERDINEVRNSTPVSRLEKFKSGGNSSGSVGPGQNDKDSGLEGRELYEAKAAVLQIVLDYLYGGKGQEAWQTLQKMWPYPDNVRIRQLILQARSRGLLSEVNRQPAKAQQAQTEKQPAPVSQQ